MSPTWSIKNPIPALMLFVLADLRRPDRVQRHEGAELSGRGLPTISGDGEPARRLAHAARKRCGPKGRKQHRHAAGPHAHRPRCRTAESHHLPVPPKPTQGRWTTCTQPWRDARRHRPDDATHHHQDGMRPRSGAGIHRGLAAHGRRALSWFVDQRQWPEAAHRARRGRREPRWAGWIGRCMRLGQRTRAPPIVSRS